MSKEIKLIIDDDVFKNLYSEITVYGLVHAGGNTNHMEFLMKLFNNIKDENPEWHCHYNKKKKDEK